MSVVERWTLAALVTALGVQYATYGLFRHWTFGSSSYDLGIFDQAVWHLSRFEAPASTITGYPNILADHFSPILALLAPLYWVASGPDALILSQAALFAMSAVPIYLLLREDFSAGIATTLTAAYGEFWGLQRAAAFDFHELAFAPLLIATATLAFRRRHFAGMAICLALLATVKEDMLAIVAGFGLLLVGRGEILRGALVSLVAVLAFIAVVLFVMPTFNAAGASAYAGVFPDFRHPLAALMVLVDPPSKLYTVFLWLVPFLFLPLFSPYLVAIVPLALTRLLSVNASHWGPAFTFSAPFAPLLVVGAADGLRRLTRRAARPWLVRTLAFLVLLCCLILPGNQPLWDLFKTRHYRATNVTLTGQRALLVIPPEASVVAQDAVVPHLSHRREVYLLKEGAPLAEFVVAANDLSPWPNQSHSDVARLMARFVEAGYSTAFHDSGWTVLAKPPPPPDPAVIRQMLWDQLQPVTLQNCRLKRFGEPSDGGYLVCGNLLDHVAAGYSYGISGYDGWGCDVATILRVPVHEYDCFDLRAPNCGGRTVFHGECIGKEEATLDGRPFDTLEHQLASNGHGASRIVMKIDVEGAEWDVFMSSSDEVLDRIDQLIVEFHGTGELRFLKDVQRLERYFHVANLHMNNHACSDKDAPFPAWAYEVLFVSKRLAVGDVAPRTTPFHELDRPNTMSVADCQPRPTTARTP